MRFYARAHVWVLLRFHPLLLIFLLTFLQWHHFLLLSCHLYQMILSQMKFAKGIHFISVKIWGERPIEASQTAKVIESLNEERKEELMVCIMRDVQRGLIGDLRAIYAFLQPLLCSWILVKGVKVHILQAVQNAQKGISVFLTQHIMILIVLLPVL